MNYDNCNAKNAQKVLVKHFYSNHTIMLSCEDKCIFNIGALGCPLVSCPKINAGWVADEVEVIVADHNTVIKSNLVPNVTFDIDTPKTANLSNFYNVDVHIRVKDSKILPTSTARQAM